MIKYQFFLKLINIQIIQVVLIFDNFGVLEVFEQIRLLQTVLFLTDSVFRVLFAYFDESMASIGGYEPYRSWSTLGLTLI